MAEINRVKVFSDGAGNSQQALVDSQRRVVTIGSGYPSTIYPGNTGSISANTEVTIVSYTVPAGKTFYLTGWQGTGTADGCFRLYRNSTQLKLKRNSAADRDVEGNYQNHPVEFVAGDQVKITVEHRKTTTQIFDGALMGFELSV